MSTLRRLPDADAALVGQIILLDLWASDAPLRSKSAAAWSIPNIRDVVRDRSPRSDSGPGTSLGALPATVVLAASRRGLDPANGEARDRVSGYLCAVGETFPDAPWALTRGVVSDETERYLSLFEDWFAKHEAGLQSAANAETEELERVRRRLRASWIAEPR